MPSTAVPAPRDAVFPAFTAVTSAPPPRSAPAGVVLLTVVALGLSYVGWRLGRGWVPLDDGALGHTAERVLHGELPHRDFDDVYTGGLGYLNAAAFRIFGTTLWSLRLALLAFLVAWVPAVYYVASRFVGPLAAGAATLLAVVWSVPNYPAAMPSWYNLFFATFGVAALLRHVEDGKTRWLVAAGLAGGVSFLVKVVGLYYVAGALLFLAFHAHAESRAAAGAAPGVGRGYAMFVTGALAIFVTALVALVSRHPHGPEVVQFVVPGAAVAALLAWTEWRVPAGTSGARFAALARRVVPFLLGVALPIAVFLTPYLRTGSLDAFVTGVFVLPTKRFGFAVLRAPPFWTIAAVIPIVALAVGGWAVRGRSGRWWLALLVPALAALFAASLVSDAAYRFVWYSARNLPPLLILAGVVMVARRASPAGVTSPRRSGVVLVLSVTALCSLVQFPYAAANYFCYVAPLVVLSAVALLHLLPRMTPAIPGAVVVFYAAFAVTRTNASPLFRMGERYLPPLPSESLALPRAGIEIPSYQAPVYRALVTALRARARGGYTWASPDCPEIYFLSGLGNPTRSLYDFFDDPRERRVRVLSALDTRGVTAIVLNRLPAFSPRLTTDPDLVVALERRYPFAAEFGPYQMRWRP